MGLNLSARKEEQIKRGGNFLAKTVMPGEGIYSINSIECKASNYNGTEGYDMILHVEGEDLTEQGFEGFFIDMHDQSLGRHKGAVGRVKFRQYSYSDKTFPATATKPELTMFRDDMIMDDIAHIAKAVGKYDELFVGEIADVPSLAAKATVMFKGLQIKLCIGGREYLKDAYVKYDLHLVRADKGFVNVEAVNAATSRLQAYDPAKHIVKAKEKVADVMDMGSFEPVEVEMDFHI